MEVAEPLITELATKYEKAVNIGIEKNIEYKPTRTYINTLKQDVWVFSGLKSYIQLKEASLLLLNDKGELKPFYKFRDDVLAIHKKYNLNYLKAEYEHSVNSSQMASRWKHFEHNSDKYYLQYRTASDEKVRESHSILDKITLPITDQFWDSYFPPNGWNCRCTTVQVLKSSYKATNSETANALGHQSLTVTKSDGSVNIKATANNQIFKFNPGKQGVIFPENHPYKKYQTLVSGSLQPIIKRAFDNKIKIERKEVLNFAKTKIVNRNFKIGSQKITIPNTTIKKNLRQDVWFFDRVDVIYNIESVLKKAKKTGTKKVVKSDYTESKWKRKQFVKQYIFYESEWNGINLQLDIEELYKGDIKLYNIKILK